MNVFLLYSNQEWTGNNRYFDYKSIISDLGLESLFRVASREQIEQDGLVQSILEADTFLELVMTKVMMAPLMSADEILYRQEIMKDFLDNKEYICQLYEFAQETLAKWDKLGRGQSDASNTKDSVTNLVTNVHVLRLFVERMATLRELCGNYRDIIQSEGLKSFVNRLNKDFSEEIQENLEQLLDDITFFADKERNPYEWQEKRKDYVKKSRIVMQCQFSEGLKFDTLKLEEVETLGKKYKKRKRKKTMMERYLGVFAPEITFLHRDDYVLADMKQLEYQVVNYIMSYCETFIRECKNFFEQLAFQTGFYMGALHISQRMERHKIDVCYPTVGPQDGLKFQELKDIGMLVEQCVNPVGNDSAIRNKMLLVVTGANQGGKSTFLRSIGIAQIMMQCGLFVGAKQFESGIYPAFFTHFTRREDSQMNSGRLDEELGRMSQIIDNLGDRSLVLLNESFATTTEKEGSDIAYEIIKALVQGGVKVLTVTHLLTFAKQVYEENNGNVEFLSAERKEDGSRTFKMVQAAPQMTSFGLDLYEEIIV